MNDFDLPAPDPAEPICRRAIELAHLAGGKTTMHITYDESVSLNRAFAPHGGRSLHRGILTAVHGQVTAIHTVHGVVALHVKPFRANAVRDLMLEWDQAAEIGVDGLHATTLTHCAMRLRALLLDKS